MNKKIALKPATVFHPHPVLLVGTYGEDGKPNLMNAAWGGICCSDPPCVAVSLREATLTYHNILRSRETRGDIPIFHSPPTIEFDPSRKIGMSPLSSTPF